MQFMVLVDTTIVNVALPSIQRDLVATASQLTWVVNGYLLAGGGLLLLGGRVADLAGRRRVFLIGTALFALGSLVSGAAVSIEMLIAGRLIQGAGEAFASPAALSLVALLFTEPTERAKAFAIWGGLAGVGATAGVVLSGILTSLIHWRWIFFINLPLAFVPLILVPRLVGMGRRASAKPGSSLDLVGAVLITGGLGCVVYGLVEAGHQPSGSLGPILVGVTAIAGFVLVESRIAAPLVPLRFFANPVRLMGNFSAAFLVSTTTAMFFLATLHMQQVLGYSPVAAGLAYLPLCLMILPGLAASARLTTRVGPLAAASAGLACCCLGALLYSRLSVGGSYVADLLPAMILVGLGMGITNPAMQNAMLHGVSERDAGLGSGVGYTVGQLSGALGVAILATLAIRRQQTDLATGVDSLIAQVNGYKLGFTVAAVALAASAILVAVLALLHKQRRQSTAAHHPARPL
ncbi:MFS transporter [Saccharopolyspora phatthalungensis]|uniref:EmrB/QacA subfamily drug resistance transporter n=1 Tax=Saccharopolyspora phatthalungensis TaxID=664693 RepID=A0A840QCE4_9PSEU|nr:MFS transporter [Saccharopolyspora phatthalungensis]MBB5158404.1 EmrB/QacA subfamily drug resistance transporter [Saccharopolyspora phatthalungensis]